MKPIQLIVNGVVLHERFSALVLDALDRMEAQPLLPPLPKGHVYFQASDNSIHSIPRKQLTQARRIDPGLVVVVSERVVNNSQGSGSFTVSSARRQFPKFTRSERDVLESFYLLSFMSHRA